MFDNSALSTRSYAKAAEMIPEKCTKIKLKIGNSNYEVLALGCITNTTNKERPFYLIESETSVSFYIVQYLFAEGHYFEVSGKIENYTFLQPEGRAGGASSSQPQHGSDFQTDD